MEYIIDHAYIDHIMDHTAPPSDPTPNLYSDYSTNATPDEELIGLPPMDRYGNIIVPTEKVLRDGECPDGYEFVNTCPPNAPCIKRMGYCKKKVATTSISSTTTPTTTTKMQWVLPALVVGAGLFLIFRKSE